jgi:ketosteroid isomerase-like protein
MNREEMAMNQDTADSGRRAFLGAVAVGAGATMLAADAAAQTKDNRAAGVEAAFRAAFKPAAEGRPGDARLAFLADQALVVDHDVPFPMDRATYADHLGFHADKWQRHETALSEVKVALHGDTAIVSAYFNERGKPVGAGFRLRPGYCTAVCIQEGGTWQAIALHLSTLSSQIMDASPG